MKVLKLKYSNRRLTNVCGHRIILKRQRRLSSRGEKCPWNTDAFSVPQRRIGMR